MYDGGSFPDEEVTACVRSSGPFYHIDNHNFFLNISHLNVNRLRNKIDEITTLLGPSNTNILCLTETFLNPNVMGKELDSNCFVFLDEIASQKWGEVC